MSNTDYVVVVVLPDDAVGDEHVTVMGFGKLPEVAPFDHLAAVCAVLARMVSPFIAVAGEEAMFGPERDTLVNKMSGHDLWVLWDSLSPIGRSGWGFNPHMTVQPGRQPLAPGTWVRFNRLALWYGENRLTWQLGTGALRAS